MKKKKSLVLIITVLVLATLCFTGCGNNDKQTDSPEAGAKKFSGTTLNVLLPPWYEFSPAMLDDFTKETGIKVDLQIMDWDPCLDKIVTSNAAGVAPADVTVMNWDWVGKFGAAGWCEPLNNHFDDDFFEDITTRSLFKYKDQYIAIPIYNDFRVTYINKDYFKKAGIERMPTTPDELMQDAITIKEKGVCEYPLLVPFTATGATTTPWYLLTKAYGGELLSETNEPLFASKDSAGYKAMEFLIKGLKDYQVIDPASIGWKGTDVVDNFKAGQGAIDIAGWAGNVSLYTNPKESKIVDSVQVIKVPGQNGKSRTYGLQEGLSVPAKSKNKEAAVEFIRWLNTPENVEKLFIDKGIFPNHHSTIVKLANEGKLPGGQTMVEVLPTIESLFPQGVPEWNMEFETETFTTMNQMAKGAMTLDQGMNHLADTVKKLNQSKP
ncbi:MAG: sugar ABC transporter substrate-binding protein [Syntrophomonadaceae bacterium]|nr:sugar ABC transporter substrate-binding protein [Syntrophomonadaceae bacterium]